MQLNVDGGHGNDSSAVFTSCLLHMVVLKAKRARYSVINNSLLDSLSNKTMLAIAKGLQPLSAGG